MLARSPLGRIARPAAAAAAAAASPSSSLSGPSSSSSSWSFAAAAAFQPCKAGPSGYRSASTLPPGMSPAAIPTKRTPPPSKATAAPSSSAWPPQRGRVKRLQHGSWMNTASNMPAGALDTPASRAAARDPDGYKLGKGEVVFCNHSIQGLMILRRFSTSASSDRPEKHLLDGKSPPPQQQQQQRTQPHASPFPPRSRSEPRKGYPPPRAEPEPIIFDKPAVPNPAETAEAHARFRSGSRKVAFGVLAAVVAGVALYLAAGPTLHADEARKGIAALQTPGVEVSPSEEKLPQGALGTGSYALVALKRSSIIAKAATLCILDYKRTLGAKYASREEEMESLRQCHLRSAHRILEALQKNGGLYIKLGQHLSSVILLPVEWTSTMKPLQDRNEPTPLPQLETMFKAETGKSFDDCFSEMVEKPIGVASLAQVHKVRDRETGEWLALKLMHPEVERFSQVDMETVNVLVKWVKRVFPQFEFSWLAEEMRESLPLEMNFRHEAQNSRRAAADFAGYRHTSVYIPKVRYVTKRIMAMEFIDGCRPDNLEYLAEHNIDRNRVSQELSRVFAQQLYMHGFFHGDPHGGNLLIRPAQKGSRSKYNFEVVLLDHGLYFDIDKELRTNYARFWLSLLKSATPSVVKERRQYAKTIANIDDDLYPILESAITGRSGLEGSDPNNPHGVKGKSRPSSLLDMNTGSGLSQDEQDHIRKTVMEREGLFVSILDLLRRVPRRMLMVLKLNDLTRALDANLHTTHGPIRPFIIAARYCALAVWDDDKRKLAQRRREKGLSISWLRDWLGSWWQYIYFYRGLSFLEGLSDLNARRRKVFSFSRALAMGKDARKAVSGLEEQEEKRSREAADSQRAKAAIDKERRRSDLRRERSQKEGGEKE